MGSRYKGTSRGNVSFASPRTSSSLRTGSSWYEDPVPTPQSYSRGTRTTQYRSSSSRLSGRSPPSVQKAISPTPGQLKATEAAVQKWDEKALCSFLDADGFKYHDGDYSELYSELLKESRTALPKTGAGWLTYAYDTEKIKSRREELLKDRSECLKMFLHTKNDEIFKKHHAAFKQYVGTLPKESAQREAYECYEGKLSSK